ncbi:MAG: hypothetical protein ACE5GC_01105 [Acidimicrobiia bacterium]
MEIPEPGAWFSNMTMNALDRLRLTPRGHGALLTTTSWAAAVFTVVLPYLIVGVSRYSLFTVIEPAPLARVAVIGLIGWGIVAVSVHLASGILGADASWSVSALVTAQAHLPLGAAAIAIFGLSFALQAFTVSRVAAIVGVTIWFPGALVAATAYAAATEWQRAVLPGLAVATVWGLTTGLPVLRLIGHLL